MLSPTEVTESSVQPCTSEFRPLISILKRRVLSCVNSQNSVAIKSWRSTSIMASAGRKCGVRLWTDF